MALKLPSITTRQYRYFVLENALKVLVVSDPETDKAAASCDVNVGYFADPALLPGLAHFLEHMLFLGSKKYPEESAYKKFLSAHGGSSNAGTSAESTNYYFDITKDHLKGALDIFAQFFIAPLMNENAVDREVNAVNNENKKNLQDDVRRSIQILKAHCNPAHPYSKFSTGNVETLQTEPAKHNIVPRQALIELYNQHYSSTIMSLCVLGAESLETLESWVRESFSAVANKGIARLTWPPVPVIMPDQLGQILSMPAPPSPLLPSFPHPPLFFSAPVKDVRSVKLTWPIPPQWSQYKEKNEAYCSHLLGHEGPGSLFALLKAKQWATALSAGSGNSLSDFAFLTVDIELTEQGFAHREDVVVLTFEYLHLLRGTGALEWIWKELALIHSLKFNFQAKPTPISHVSSLSRNMQWHQPEDILSGPVLFETFNAQGINTVLRALTLDNCIVQYSAKEFEGSTNRVERWYQANYSANPISESLRARIEGISSHEAALSMPRPNAFIPTRLSLKSDDCPALVASTPPLVVSKIPTLIVDGGLSKAWHRLDTSFGEPKSTIRLQMLSPETNASAINTARTDLLVSLVEDALKERLYDAQVVGLSFALTANLELSGFDDKLGLLLRMIVGEVKTIRIDPSRLAIYQEKLRLEYQNHSKDPVYLHSSYYAGLALVTPSWTYEEKLSALLRLDADDIQRFIPSFFSSLHLEWLIYGNYTSLEAKQAVADVEAILQVNAGASAPQAPQRTVKLRKGITYLAQQPEPNPNEVNSVVRNTYQLGPKNNFKLAAQCSLLEKMLHQPAFEQLRTKEQLGYIVLSGIRPHYGIQTWNIVVQSSDYDAAYLESRVEAFIIQAKALLEAMDDKVFQGYIDSVSALKFEKPQSLTAQASKIWDEIAERRYVFSRPELEVEEMKKVTKAEMVALFERAIANKSTRRKLSVLVYSKNRPLEPRQSSPELVSVTDFNKLKESLPLYPWQTPQTGPQSQNSSLLQ